METQAGRGWGHSTTRTTAPLTPARHGNPPLAVTVTSGAEPQAAFNCHYYYHRFQRLLPSLSCGDARNFPQMLTALIWDGQEDPHVPAMETCCLLCFKDEEPTCSPAHREMQGFGLVPRPGLLPPFTAMPAIQRLLQRGQFSFPFPQE